MVELPKKEANNTRPVSQATTTVEDDGTAVADSSSEVSATEAGRRAFELRNLSVKFPEGKLTVVTGPTASGKTALLVSSISFNGCIC